MSEKPRVNHMEYMEGMEVLDSDVMEQVIAAMNAYDYSQYTEEDVRRALSHDMKTVRISRHSCLRQRCLFWKRWLRRHRGRPVNISAIRFTCLLRFILPITVRIIVFTAVLTATIRLRERS